MAKDKKKKKKKSEDAYELDVTDDQLSEIDDIWDQDVTEQVDEVLSERD